MPEDTRKIEVAIVGGGFGGLAAAIGLQQYPHLNVNVYEGARKFSEIGAGIVLGPNAQAAMDVLDPRIKQGFNKRAVFTTIPPNADGLYQWLSLRKGQEPDLGKHIYSMAHKVKASTIHRAHFLDELVKLVDPDKAHFGKRIDAVYETDGGDSKIAMHFKDGTVSYADIVIGADGIHSILRKHILGAKDPSAEAMFYGTVVYRALVPIEKVKERLGYVPGGVDTLCGTNGSITHYPLSSGQKYFIACTCYGISGWQHDHHAEGTDLSEAKAKFADWSEEARALADLLPEKDTTGWAVHEMAPASTYYKGRCVVLGDAAHASSPHQGSGASQALEDAAVLSRILGKYLDPVEAPLSGNLSLDTLVPLLFQAYDATRRFRSQRVVFTSREAGRIASCTQPGMGNTADELRKQMEGRFDWIWNLDQEVQVKDACELYESLRRAALRTDL